MATIDGLAVGDKVEVMRAGEKPSSAAVTELTPLGSFVTWQADRRAEWWLIDEALNASVIF